MVHLSGKMLRKMDHFPEIALEIGPFPEQCSGKWYIYPEDAPEMVHLTPEMVLSSPGNSPFNVREIVISVIENHYLPRIPLV